MRLKRLVQMNSLFDGIQVGLILSILLGPIFFSLIQASVEQGIRAGTTMGLGIWISDVLFICSVYWGISYVSNMVKWQGFSLTVGIIGSLILIGFGVGTLLKKMNDQQLFSKSTQRHSSYISLWTKGFLINTLNPFTILFWVGIMGTVILDGELAPNQAFLFFGGIIGTIVTTDFTKIVLSKQIRRWMKPIHLIWLRRISGAALIIFGFVLLVRVIFFPT